MRMIGAFAAVLFVEGCLAGAGQDASDSQRALARYLEQRKAYAARVLEEVGVLPEALRESSGLAVSRTQPGVLWSINDSGNAPDIYAVDASGHLRATIPVANATNRDWEEMSSGRCPPGLVASTPSQVVAPDCLYLADIGDNDRKREELTIYVVVEPVLPPEGVSPPAVAARSFRFRYPDQPHDSEALAVLPDGEVTIVSKGRTGTIEFFGISGLDVARAITSGEVLTARNQGDTGIRPDQQIGRLVTGAALSPDGTTLAVRTYNEVFFYAAVRGGPDGTRWRDLQRPCSLGDAEPQGEAIAYLDAKTMLLTSETSRGRPGTIHRLQCE
jgi:hypothetical protein